MKTAGPWRPGVKRVYWTILWNGKVVTMSLRVLQPRRRSFALPSGWAEDRNQGKHAALQGLHSGPTSHGSALCAGKEVFFGELLELCRRRSRHRVNQTTNPFFGRVRMSG
jgi:hypothetical protein